MPKRKTPDSKIGRLSAGLLVLITEAPGSIHIRDLYAANPTATRSEMSNALVDRLAAGKIMRVSHGHYALPERQRRPRSSAGAPQSTRPSA